MKHIIASISALVMLILTFFLSSLLLPLILPKGAFFNLNLLLIHTNNPIGLLIAIIAAASTYKATMNRYE